MRKGFSLRRLLSRQRGSDGNGTARGEVVRASRLSRKEELSTRLKEGFEGLSNLLGTINTRLELQQDRHADLTSHVRDLPDLLRNIHQQILNQQQTFSALRDTLLGVERAIENQSTAVRDLEAGYRDTIESFHGSQDKVLATFQRAQRDSLESFRRNQDRQGRRFEEVLQQTQHSFTKLLVLFLVAIMSAVLLAILFTRSPL